jgi:circadian clock protein KaiB
MDKFDGPPIYDFVLYVAGSGARSSKTIANLRKICERYLSGRHRLEVVDVRSYPDRAENANILITPTLIRQAPPPVRRVVGDLSDTKAVLYGLDLEPESPSPESPKKGEASHELA